MPIEEIEKGRTPYQKRKRILSMGVLVSILFTILKLVFDANIPWIMVIAPLWIPCMMLTVMEILGFQLLDES